MRKSDGLQRTTQQVIEQIDNELSLRNRSRDGAADVVPHYWVVKRAMSDCSDRLSKRCGPFPSMDSVKSISWPMVQVQP